MSTIIQLAVFPLCLGRRGYFEISLVFLQKELAQREKLFILISLLIFT